MLFKHFHITAENVAATVATVLETCGYGADEIERVQKTVRKQGLDSQIAFFRWSVEGREGLGTYEVARSADG